MERPDLDGQRKRSLPGPLRDRLADDADGGAALHDLLRAAEQGLERCTGARAHERETALELLAADARLTWACRQALREGGGAATLSEIAARIAALDPRCGTRSRMDDPPVAGGDPP